MQREMMFLWTKAGGSLVFVLLGRSCRCWKHLAVRWRFPAWVLGSSGVVLEPCHSPCCGRCLQEDPPLPGRCTRETRATCLIAREAMQPSCHRPLLLWQWLLCSGKSFAQPVPGACTLNLLKGWCSAGQRGGWVGGKAERPTLSFLPFPSGTFLPWSGASAGLGRARLVKASPVLLAAWGR